MIAISKTKTITENLEHCMCLIIVEGIKIGILGLRKQQHVTTTNIDISGENQLTEDELKSIVIKAMEKDKSFRKFVEGKVSVDVVGIYNRSTEVVYNTEYNFKEGMII